MSDVLRAGNAKLLEHLHDFDAVRLGIGTDGPFLALEAIAFNLRFPAHPEIPKTFQHIPIVRRNLLDCKPNLQIRLTSLFSGHALSAGPSWRSSFRGWKRGRKALIELLEKHVPGDVRQREQWEQREQA